MCETKLMKRKALRKHSLKSIIYNVQGFLSISGQLWRWIKRNFLHVLSVRVITIPLTCPQRASFSCHCLKTCAFSIANGNQLIFVCTGSRDITGEFQITTIE